MKEKLIEIQNSILEMLRNEFSGEFNAIHIFDVCDENTCLGVEFHYLESTNESITLNRFYDICNQVNEENKNVYVDIIQNIDFFTKQIDYGFVINTKK